MRDNKFVSLQSDLQCFEALRSRTTIIIIVHSFDVLYHYIGVTCISEYLCVHMSLLQYGVNKT